jgi:ketosteroid isomerase-like protein
MTGRSFSLLAAFALASLSCARPGVTGPRSGSAREAIDTIHRTMEDAFQSGHADVIARIYATDAEQYVPETPVVRGRPAIEQAWKATVGSGGNRLRVEVSEVEQDGDRAHEIGRFTISAPDGAVLAAAKYLVIWGRDAGGEWKARRDIYNWDIPPGQRP